MDLINDKINIIHGDSFLLCHEWPEGAALVCDPPYGIAFNYGAKRSRKSGLDWGRGNEGGEHDRNWRNIHGDDRPFDPTPFLRFSVVCLWGGNNFTSRLPESRGWLVWDKLGDKAPCAFGDCELAWTSRDMSIRIHRQLWRGLVREGEENVSNGPKLHPAQKPVRLMMWTLQVLGLPKDTLVIDPFMGCGTIGVACHRLGLRYLGIEIDQQHYETAKKRLKEETRQGCLESKILTTS